MSFEECNVFEAGSRKWKICRDEAGLSIQKTNAYRKQWGLALLDVPAPDLVPAEQETTVDPIPEFIFHGHSVSDETIDVRKKLYGPGTELLRIYEAAGAPTCPACMQLAQEMNNWGAAVCRHKIEEIVLDILPRAKAWLDEMHPWAVKLVPNKIEEYALMILIRADVTKAIDESERLISERRKLNLNIYRRKKKSCSACGGGPIRNTTGS